VRFTVLVGRCPAPDLDPSTLMHQKGAPDVVCQHQQYTSSAVLPVVGAAGLAMVSTIACHPPRAQRAWGCCGWDCACNALATHGEVHVRYTRWKFMKSSCPWCCLLSDTPCCCRVCRLLHLSSLTCCCQVQHTWQGVGQSWGFVDIRTFESSVADV